ncbi:MAG: serine/threonine-protein kinase [Nannocystaceae bacterium]
MSDGSGRVSPTLGGADTQAPLVGTAPTALGGHSPGSSERLRRGQLDAWRQEDSSQQPRIGRFTLLDKVGEGGMGRVYTAFDRRLDRKIAIKLIRQGHANDPQLRERMLREAQAMARLSHPNVIPVYEAGEFGDQVFVAMEFVDGQTLKRWQHPVKPWQEVLDMYLQVGRGLAAAHAVGLVHRDFKPQNVLVGSDGRPRVIDFGLARSQSAVDTHTPPDARGANENDAHTLLDSPMTHTGAMMGTPAYMAPEQFNGSASPASDQFAFCVALFEALYGTPPFPRETLDQLLASFKQAPVSVPVGHGVPGWLHTHVVRGLGRDPDARFPTMDMLLSQMEHEPTIDRASDWQVRAKLMASIVAILLLSWLIIAKLGVTEQGGDASSLVLIHAVASTLLAIPAVLARDLIKRNRQTREMAIWASLGIAGIMLDRVAGVLANSPIPTTLMHDQLILAAVSAAMSRVIGPWVWWAVAIAATGGLVSGAYPELASSSFGFTGLLSTLIMWGFYRRDGLKRSDH